MKEILQRLQGTRVLVVGDLMVDRYQWGEVDRISPEAPVPVVKLLGEELRLGGAANVAHNLTVLGCAVQLCGLVGADPLAKEALRLLEAMGVGRRGVIADADRPTTEKTRIMANNQQMLRSDRESAAPPGPEISGKLMAFLRKAGRFDGVIVSDYGKGVISERVMAALLETVRKSGKKIVVDPKGLPFDKYRGATCLTPNENEAAAAARSPISGEEDALRAARALMGELSLEFLCMTRGRRGVLAVTRKEHRFLAARAHEVFDVTGAGDTFVAAFGAAFFAGEPFFESVTLANVAAGIVVGRVGTATVLPEEILSATEGLPKFFTAAGIEALARRLHEQKKRIVFTNGCFDLLHAGHVQYLQESRKLGDVLIIGLNSDASVRRLKGPNRPVLQEEDRARLLGALASVDYVVVFEEDDPLELIRKIRPDVLTKGADYTLEGVVGGDLVKKWGGEVRLIPLAENRSTSGLIEKIAKAKRR